MYHEPSSSVASWSYCLKLGLCVFKYLDGTDGTDNDGTGDAGTGGDGTGGETGGTGDDDNKGNTDGIGGDGNGSDGDIAEDTHLHWTNFLFSLSRQFLNKTWKYQTSNQVQEAWLIIMTDIMRYMSTM